MPPAIAVAGITAAASIGGAVLGAGAQKKAASQAADAQKESSAEQIAFAKDVYASNAARLDPYSSMGLPAGGVLAGLLFGGTGTGTATPTGPAYTNPTVAQEAPIDRATYLESKGNWERQHRSDYPLSYERWVQARGGTPGPGALASPMPAPSAAPAFSAMGSQQAWDTFRNSTNYQWRFNEGMKGQQVGMGALGAFDSGATRKKLTEWGQNFASNELGTYMDRLASMYGMGLSGASALAGVSQNMVSSVNNANQASASAAANAALIRGNANQKMWSEAAGALGSLASSFIKPSPPKGG